MHKYLFSNLEVLDLSHNSECALKPKITRNYAKYSIKYCLFVCLSTPRHIPLGVATASQPSLIRFDVPGISFLELKSTDEYFWAPPPLPPISPLLINHASSKENWFMTKTVDD